MNGLRRKPAGKGLGQPPRHTVNGAFTLIELLVVVAIIAILAAMLLPTLASAKVQAWRTQCLNNEHQLAITWMLYSGDYHDTFAQNGGDTSTTSSQSHLWVYGGNHGDPDTLTNVLYLNDPRYAQFSSLLHTWQPYRCPADRSTWPLQNGRFVTELRSYSMNAYIGTSAAIVAPLSLTPNYRVYLKSADLDSDSPADRFLFMDVNPASICTPAFGVDMTLNTFIHYPSDMHAGRSVVSFADGHVAAHKWTDGRTKIGLPPGRTYIPHGTSSPNNADLNWIGAHTTSHK